MNLAGFDRRDLGMLNNLFRMSLSDRFLGSTLGLIWAILSPLLLLSIFTFVFTFVFPSRLAGKEGAHSFIIWLISGYGPWLALSEGLSFATGSVVGNAGIVKNIAFKSELLPMVGSLMGLVPLGVSLALILVLMIVGGQWPPLALAWLPLAIFLQFIFVSGLGLFLGALNVFLRDTQLVLPNLLTLILFASPIFYPLTAYPAWSRNILVFNPFYVIAECYRAPVLDGVLPPMWMVAYMIVVAALTFAGGLWWFRRLKSFLTRGSEERWLELVAIHQPNFFPWLGYFDKIRRANIFIFLDAVAYPRSGSGGMGSWVNRVRLNIQGEARWITCPLKRLAHSEAILTAEIDDRQPWRRNLIRTLVSNYGKAPQFEQGLELLRPLIMQPQRNIAEFNIALVQAIAGHLKLTTRFVRQSELRHTGSATALLISLVKAVGGNAYLAGGGATGYQEDELFVKCGLRLIAQEFSPAVYGDARRFVPGLSVIDYLMHDGRPLEELLPDSTE